MKLKNYRVRTDLGVCLWFKGAIFWDIDECNKFIGENKGFALLVERKNWKDEPYYIVAHEDDKGKEKLDLHFESEDTGFCKKFYKSECGFLYVLTPDGLHTCANDSWREADTPVNQNYFNLIG